MIKIPTEDDSRFPRKKKLFPTSPFPLGRGRRNRLRFRQTAGALFFWKHRGREKTPKRAHYMLTRKGWKKEKCRTSFFLPFSPQRNILSFPSLTWLQGGLRGKREGGRPLYGVGVGGGSRRRQTQKTSAEINEMFRLSRKMNSFGCSSPVM